jgi:hypothetical protein
MTSSKGETIGRFQNLRLDFDHILEKRGKNYSRGLRKYGIHQQMENKTYLGHCM